MKQVAGARSGSGNAASIVDRKAARREWTAGDIRDLKSLAKKKTPAGKIAKSLKRTVGATRQKAFSLGVSLDSRG
jgi:uncharacterized protein (UPF0218 family)